MQVKTSEWNNSYSHKDNIIFYPHEEVIRFTSKYIRKRVGFGTFSDVYTAATPARVLDLGIGIGRHIKFFYECGLQAHGINLSQVALDAAAEIFRQQRLVHLLPRLYCDSATQMPVDANFFDFAVSYVVLDSIPFDIARLVMKERSRRLTPGALMYLDLISGDDSEHYPECSGEETVESEHEKGTIQLDYNWHKIEELLGTRWHILEAVKIKRTSVITRGSHSRYHLVVKNIKAE